VGAASCVSTLVAEFVPKTEEP
ncbi:MAG: hypothetical protein JWM74_3734, partial [Myxococcaceae bacterium]|nr:hypothetical protein [Myxococcaceae bacterium]